ncbi:olfactory receptor 867 [Heterocephalus glaber]|uniref:Olfactory receptor n=1 Tax=Heterocephalus glaber TaxID=10181 RepID=A0AAX6S3N8_HETGA|nr:olfactory receptor 867 [Heterocephalus glaber]
MYLVTVLGNLLIILAVISDSHLHTPMYFFLSNLSAVDICFTSTVLPEMIVDISTHSRVISYMGCLTQMSFFLMFACMDAMLLTVMAYDRFLAICHPLHYAIIMNPRLCVLLLLLSHLSVVCLFYGTAIGVYLGSSVSYSPRKGMVLSLMYTVVTPMLNPFIYSLRNRDITSTLKRLHCFSSLISGCLASIRDAIFENLVKVNTPNSLVNTILFHI